MNLATIFTEPVILSGLGGLSYPLLSMVEGLTLKNSKRPTYKDLAFYISIIINVFFALLIGYAYFDNKTLDNKLLAIHIGVSAPLILRTMANIIPSDFRNH